MSGKVSASATVETMIVDSIGPTVTSGAIKITAKPINPAKIQVPNSTSQGVMLSVTASTAFMLWRFSSCAAANEMFLLEFVGAGSGCDTWRLAFLGSFFCALPCSV